MNPGVRRAIIGLSMLAMALLAGDATACPVCYGNSDSGAANGVNNAVLLLLGIVALVQVGFVALFYTFWRRSREIRQRREKFRLIAGFGR